MASNYTVRRIWASRDELHSNDAVWKLNKHLSRRERVTNTTAILTAEAAAARRGVVLFRHWDRRLSIHGSGGVVREYNGKFSDNNTSVFGRCLVVGVKSKKNKWMHCCFRRILQDITML